MGACWQQWRRVRVQAELEQLLDRQPQLAAGARLQRCQPVGGGCSQQTYQLQLSDGRLLFAKAGDPSMLKAEQRGLQALHRHLDPTDLWVPEPLVFDADASARGWLLLSWHGFTQGDQARLGRGLARLHRQSAQQGSLEKGTGWFGWAWDGYIGLGHQPGGWCQSWGEAFVELRLRPQLEQAQSWGLALADLDPWLHELRDRLDRHGPDAALVHGDLWGGNAAVLADGRGLIFDPASWWADREVDLALTQCFGGFSQAFYNGYHQEWPLPPGAKQRVEIYNLYHWLNHANLFGGGYRQQCLRFLEHRAPLSW